MRILGGIAVLLAALMFVITVALLLDISHMNRQVEQFSDFQALINDVAGQSQRNRAHIDGTKIVALMFGLGTVLIGGLGVVFIAVSFLPGKKPPAIVTPASRQGGG
jgi:hypothetical protein